LQAEKYSDNKTNNMQYDFTWPAISKWSNMIRMLGFLLFCSCQHEEPYRVPEIAGYYQMESLQTEFAVDLNNDGVSSTDALSQIKQADYIRVSNGYAGSVFYMEIRPTKHQNTQIQHLYVPFPDPRLIFDYPDSLKGRVVYLMNDLNLYGYGYSYDEKSKTIHLDEKTINEENEQVWGKLVDIKVVDKERLQLEVSKNYYDFKQKGWIRLQLTAIYNKVSQ
jgi:hypothetical protein